MRSSKRLQFGPYRKPRFRRGQIVNCERRGELVIVGTSTGRIPWPVGLAGCNRSLVLCGDLVRAVKMEALLAIKYWWGASASTVVEWRKVFKVPQANPGTRKIRQELAKGRIGAKARAASRLAWTSERRKKIAASKRGKKRPRYAVEAMRIRMLGVKSKPKWTSKEDKLCLTLPAKEASARTGRTVKAIYRRRTELRGNGTYARGSA